MSMLMPKVCLSGIVFFVRGSAAAWYEGGLKMVIPTTVFPIVVLQMAIASRRERVSLSVFAVSV